MHITHEVHFDQLVSIDMLAEKLDKDYSLREKIKGFASSVWSQAQANSKAELGCIVACETGDLTGDLAAYAIGIQNPIVGAATSLLFGGAYALKHTYDHAREHDTSKLGALKAAAEFAIMAKSGCVSGTTAVEYAAMGHFASGLPPTDPESLIIRFVSLPVAYVFGLGIMSILTARVKNRASGYVAESGNTPKVRKAICEIAEQKFDTSGFGNRITLSGTRNTVIIDENDNSNGTSFYQVKSRLFTHDSNARIGFIGLLDTAMEHIGINRHLHASVHYLH